LIIAASSWNVLLSVFKLF